MEENLATIEEFLVWLGGGHSPETVKSYRFALSSFIKYLVEIKKKIVKCNLNDLTHYLLWLENRGLRSGTRALYVTSVKTLWLWLWKQNRVSFSHDLIPTPTAQDKQPYPFMEEYEYNALMRSFDEFYPKELRNKTMVCLLWTTGMRLSELLSLNVSSLHFEEKYGLVRTFKRKNHIRRFYLTPELTELLQKWLQVRERVLKRAGVGAEALFIKMDTASPSKRLSRCAVQRVFRNARKSLGIEKKISPHTCRHGFGYEGAKNPHMPIRHLQELMGHAKISTTNIYMQCKDSEVEESFRTVFEQGRQSTLTKGQENTTFKANEYVWKTRKIKTKRRDVHPPQKGRQYCEIGKNIQPSQANHLGDPATVGYEKEN